MVEVVGDDHPRKLLAETLGVLCPPDVSRIPKGRSRRGLDRDHHGHLHTVALHLRGAWVHDELVNLGVGCGRKRVGRLMRRSCLVGVHARRRWRKGRPRGGPRPDLVRRDFNPTGADQLWGADVTQFRTGEGRLYLATVIDLWSRRVAGWSVGTSATSELATSELVSEALVSAATRRARPVPAAGGPPTDSPRCCDRRGGSRSGALPGISGHPGWDRRYRTPRVGRCIHARRLRLSPTDWGVPGGRMRREMGHVHARTEPIARRVPTAAICVYVLSLPVRSWADSAAPRAV